MPGVLDDLASVGGDPDGREGGNHRHGSRAGRGEARRIPHRHPERVAAGLGEGRGGRGRRRRAVDAEAGGGRWCAVERPGVAERAAAEHRGRHGEHDRRSRHGIGRAADGEGRGQASRRDIGRGRRGRRRPDPIRDGAGRSSGIGVGSAVRGKRRGEQRPGNPVRGALDGVVLLDRRVVAPEEACARCRRGSGDEIVGSREGRGHDQARRVRRCN